MEIVVLFLRFVKWERNRYNEENGQQRKENFHGAYGRVYRNVEKS